MVTIFFLLLLVLVPAFAIIFAQKFKRLESRVTAMDSLLQEMRAQPGPTPEDGEPEKAADAAAKAGEEEADTPDEVPAAEEKLTSWPVSTRVNKTGGADGATLIDRVS